MDDGNLSQSGRFDLMEDLLYTAGNGAGKPDFAALGADEGRDVFDDYDAVF
jgi:hypothetical protein